jgi:hypothetical protein
MMFNLSADSFDMAQLRDGLKRRNIYCSLRAGRPVAFFFFVPFALMRLILCFDVCVGCV